MLPFGTIRAPREILFGSGQLHALAAVAQRLGQRALIVTDARLAGDADLLPMMLAMEGAGLAVRVEAGTPPHVPVTSAIAATERQRGFARVV